MLVRVPARLAIKFIAVIVVSYLYLSKQSSTIMFSFIPSQSKATDGVTLCEGNPDYSEATKRDRFKAEGVEYMRKSVIARKGKKRKAISSIWLNGEALVRQTDSKEVYYCYLCEISKRSQQLPVLNGTRSVLDHLAAVHRLDQEGKPLGPKLEPSNQLLNFNTVVTTYSFDKFKDLLIRWIVYCQLAISMLENRYFRELVCFLNESLGKLLPQAKSTLRKWILDAWLKVKEELKKDLADALSNIPLSFDLWTSPNHYSIISVYAHFIDKEGVRRQRLLAFKRLKGAHSGKNQAGEVLAVIKDYAIPDRIGYFMTDNASSNDGCIEYVLRKLYPQVAAQQRAARRLRCFGHITNICARAALLGKGAGKAMDQAEVQLRRGDIGALEKSWRTRGAIGRLHNITRYIRMTPQRMEEFEKIKSNGELAEFDDLEVSAVFPLHRHC